MSQINQILELITNEKKILLTAHERPDGDALGSLLALRQLLDNQGKETIAIIEDFGPPCYRFLPGMDKILLAGNIAPPVNADLVIVLDSATLARIGADTKRILPPAPVLNIDHHYSNEKFGAVNWIDETHSCVGEMIYVLAKHANWTITKEIADNLYAAIYTDTGRFSFSNTTAETLKNAAELIDKGVSPNLMFRNIYMEKIGAELLLTGRVYSSLKTVSNGKIAYSVITTKDFRETNSGPELTQELVNVPRSLKGVRMAFFFYETKEDKEVKMSIRAIEPLDANEFAQKFNGGGHHRAAGATIKGKINEVVARIIAEAEKYVGD